MEDYSKTRGLGEHPNSIQAQMTPEQKRKADAKRAEHRETQKQMEDWAKRDFGLEEPLEELESDDFDFDSLQDDDDVVG